MDMKHRQRNTARCQARLWGVGDEEQEIHAKASRAVNVAACRHHTRSLSLLCRCPKYRRPRGRWGGYPWTESNWRNHIRLYGLPVRRLRRRDTAKVPERLGWSPEVDAGTQQKYDGRCNLGAMLPQQQRVARAAMWQQQQQQQSAAGDYGGPPQFAGMWPPPPLPLTVQQGAAG